MSDYPDQVRAVLVELAMLNETPVPDQQFEATGPTSGGERDHTPQPVDTALDYFVRRLERWLRDARRRLRDERKGQADERGRLPELSLGQAAYWLIEKYEGRDYRVAAQELGITPEEVKRIRRRKERREDNGRPLRRAPNGRAVAGSAERVRRFRERKREETT